MSAREQRMLDVIDYAKAHPSFTKYDLASDLGCGLASAMRGIRDARRHLGLEDDINIAYLAADHVYSLVGSWDEAEPHVARRRTTVESNTETDLAFVRTQIRTLDPGDPRWLVASTTLNNLESSLSAAANLRRHIEAASA